MKTETQVPKIEYEVVILFAGQKFKKKYFATSRTIANIAALSDARKRIRIDHEKDNVSDQMNAIISETMFSSEIINDQQALIKKLEDTMMNLELAREKKDYVLAKDTLLTIIDFFTKTYEGIDTLEYYGKMHQKEL